MQRVHRPQPHAPYTATASPSDRPSTPLPIAWTQPAVSWPSVIGSCHTAEASSS